MVKVIVGSAIGGLVAGGIALLAAGGDKTSAAPGASMQPVGPAPVAQTAAPTISCAPHQQATVARVMINGSEAATLACVDRVTPAPVAQAAFPSSPAAYAPLADGYDTQSGFVGLAPAAAPVDVIRVGQPAARPARRVVYRDANDDVVRYERDVKRGRSVAKTAMIIGGSAGTGAGVGALMGGKKGALIGAAIGGGAASIYEATKR